MKTPQRFLLAMAVAGAALVACGCADVQNPTGSLGSLGSLGDVFGKQRSAPDLTLPVKPEGAAPGQAGSVPRLQASKKAEDELKPDRTCSRPLEKFDIWAKAEEYAGVEAQLRLKRFTSSEFNYTDLTPEDKKLLNYLAVTTMWVPLSIELHVARAYDAVAGKKETLLPMQVPAKGRMEASLGLLRSQVVGFPGKVRFEVDQTVTDGVFAQLGSLITTSPGFLDLMDLNTDARDLLLAHELSHVYKRHRLKQLQTRLVATPGGFELARKLMGMSMDQSANPIASLTFLATSGPKLVAFYRESDLKFSREQELEADACAAIWLQRAGIDRCAAWRGFVTIAPKDGAYAPTHPTTAEREENFMRKLDGVACASDASKATREEPKKEGQKPPSKLRTQGDKRPQ